MLNIFGNYSLHGFVSGLFFIFLFFCTFLRDRKAEIESTVCQSDIYNSFKTTFIQYQETAFNLKAKLRLSTEVGDYIPPWWYSPHIGTLFAFGHDANIKYESEIFEDDESRFVVDWYPKKPSRTQKEDLNVIVFLPGLGLTSKNKFAQNFASTVAAAGYTVAIVGSRGIDLPLKSNRFWHPGQHDDAYTVIEHIHHEYSSLSNKNKLRIFLTGYSAGSNVTQRVILHSRDKPCRDVIKGALCVCINYDYLTSRKNLESTFVGSIYSMLMTYALKDIVKRNAHVHDSLDGGSRLINQKLSSCTFISDYDRLFSKHIHNYVSVDEMNQYVSMHDLHRIDIPLLAVQPSDDPLHMGCVRNNICLDKVTSNPNVIYLEPQHGNHFGFYEGPLTAAFSNTSSYTYPAKLAMSFFNTIVEHERELIADSSVSIGSVGSARNGAVTRTTMRGGNLQSF